MRDLLYCDRRCNCLEYFYFKAEDDVWVCGRCTTEFSREELDSIARSRRE